MEMKCGIKRGWELCCHSRYRKFVIVPVLINIFVFVLLGGFLLYYVGSWIDYWHQSLPSFLAWLTYLLWPILILIILMVFAYVFSMICALIGAPFYLMLSKAIQQDILGQCAPKTSLIQDALDIPKVLKREFAKSLGHFPYWLLGCVLSYIPGVNVLTPIYWGGCGARIFAVHFFDYPADNHHHSLKQTKAFIQANKVSCYLLGFWSYLGLSVPILNIFVLPAAVAVASEFYTHRHRQTNKVM